MPRTRPVRRAAISGVRGTNGELRALCEAIAQAADEVRAHLTFGDEVRRLQAELDASNERLNICRNLLAEYVQEIGRRDAAAVSDAVGRHDGPGLVVAGVDVASVADVAAVEDLADVGRPPVAPLPPARPAIGPRVGAHQIAARIHSALEPRGLIEVGGVIRPAVWASNEPVPFDGWVVAVPSEPGRPWLAYPHSRSAHSGFPGRNRV